LIFNEIISIWIENTYGTIAPKCPVVLTIGNLVIEPGIFFVDNVTVDVILGILDNYKDDFYGCLVNCTGNGQCIYGDNSKFRCVCREKYYIGSACEIELYACSSSPCINDGICYNDKDDGRLFDRCECPKLYEGKYCQDKINICTNQSCSMNGKCYQNSTTPQCSCYKGYTGLNCESKTKEFIAKQRKVKSFSYVAFIVLGLVFSIFISLDLLKIFEPPKRMKKTPKSPIRFIYKQPE
jgi:hypothetical protein